MEEQVSVSDAGRVVGRLAGWRQRGLKRIARRSQDESGITGLETAIILIAFVIVASVFAFVVLSTGLFSAERGKQTVLAGLEKVSGNIELRGNVILTDINGDNAIDDTGGDTIVFSLALAAGGRPVNLDPTAPSNTTVINYLDQTTRVANVPYTVTWIKGNTGNLLENGELAEITIVMPAGTALAGNDVFTLEIIPTAGGTMMIERQVPASILNLMDLH